ncbi:Imm70 family immunity protein [Streptococcus suis]|uniref:Imm70 family immunity protein n=1 Tax=Streptococcus suis TaxID=1307 RepID=UPI0004628638|nr:Imm70 family immunity protein [Streptococcus suis]HEM3214384.1 immunity 70 family protein [Streptococcus suis 12814]HEM4254484.1 immunity 70 family protein [Streptococcus suis]
MSVGLMVGYNWWTVGEGSLFNSFFSTIYVRLENNRWGSKYPIIMNKLYFGEVPLEDIEEGIVELLSIQKELKNFRPQEIIWDFEELLATPPWGNNISSHITNLSQYFITSSGSDLFEVMLTSFTFAREKGKNVIVKSI